jgi:MFS superfamily sulfate permease-like transporter
LKGEIRGTLLDVQESLAEKPASPSRWRKRAWVLALLLEQEEPVARDAAWRNAGALFRSNPGLTLALTLVVLVVAVVSVLFPSLWFILTLALLAVVCFNAAGPLLRLCRERMR